MDRPDEAPRGLYLGHGSSFHPATGTDHKDMGWAGIGFGKHQHDHAMQVVQARHIPAGILDVGRDGRRLAEVVVVIMPHQDAPKPVNGELPIRP